MSALLPSVVPEHDRNPASSMDAPALYGWRETEWVLLEDLCCVYREVDEIRSAGMQLK